MTTDVFKRVPAWRSLVWVGVVGSVLAWAWAWYLGRGPSVIMLLFAMASVALAFRATAGNRWALVGLMVAGFVMFLASLYWAALLTLWSPGHIPVQEWLASSVLPMMAAIVLLLGSVTGFRHARD